MYGKISDVSEPSKYVDLPDSMLELNDADTERSIPRGRCHIGCCENSERYQYVSVVRGRLEDKKKMP